MPLRHCERSAAISRTTGHGLGPTKKGETRTTKYEMPPPNRNRNTLHASRFTACDQSSIIRNQFKALLPAQLKSKNSNLKTEAHLSNILPHTFNFPDPCLQASPGYLQMQRLPLSLGC